MVSSKYYYYLYLMAAVMNIINLVPRVLIFTRFHGVIWSIILAVIFGSVVMYCFTVLIGKFEGQGFPEIFHAYMPQMLALPLLLYFSVTWFGAGTILLLSYVDITLRFISPDISATAVMVGFLILVAGFSRVKTASILYATETILLLCMPVIVYILVKAFINPAFNWDAVMQIFTYLWTKPKLVTVAGGSFAFTGYVNLSVFNRSFSRMKVKLRHFWIVPVSGLLILLITLIVPIGYHGTIGVEDHIYSWLSTADSMRIEMFVIERVLYLFYVSYLSMSLVTTVMYWHVGLELFKGAFKKNSSIKKGEEPNAVQKSRGDLWLEGAILLGFSSVTTFLSRAVSQVQLAQIGQWFLNFCFFSQFFLIFLLLFLVWRKRRGGVAA